MSIIKLALRKYIKIKDLSTFKNPLFIGPHPDDIEFGCGALISKLKEKNADIHFVIVTDGAAGSKDPKIDSKTLKQIRTSEAKEASSYLGVSTIDFLEFMDGGSYETEDVIKKLCPYILKYKPDIIFSPDPNLSTESHIDHLKVSSAFRDASQEVDGIIYDLGVSSFQFDIAEKGFSYNKDAKLDMRMDSSLKISAWDIVNKCSEVELSNILYKYGDEIYSRLISKKIIERRKEKSIDSTLELVDVIKSAIPKSALNKKGHPAKKTFQALRIKVNRELEVLESSLRQAIEILKSGGRIAVIDFEPLEDKIVKNVFKEGYKSISVKGMIVKNQK